jgi:polar amino acid transport system substrate-binding protein
MMSIPVISSPAMLSRTMLPLSKLAASIRLLSGLPLIGFVLAGLLLMGLLLIGLGGAAAADDPPALRDIAPAGSLRVAIAVGPAPSTFWATRDPASGAPRGVTVELAKAAAARLKLPMQVVEFPNSGEIALAAATGAWDISFMPADAEREKFVDQGPPYVVYESTYLVRAGVDIRTIADVDRPDIRVGVVAGTSTSRTVARSLQHATVSVFPKAEAAAALLRQGQIDALAMGTDALTDLARDMAGARVLDEPVQSTGVVVTVPKNRPAARDWAAHFIEEAKADGTVRRALDSAGFAGTAVAPAK